MKDNVVAVNMKRKERRELSHRSNFPRFTATTTIRSSPRNSVPNIIDSGDYQRFGGGSSMCIGAKSFHRDPSIGICDASQKFD